MRAEVGVDDQLVAAILDGGPDATVVVDAAGMIWYANRRVRDVFGWDPDELLGQHLRILIPHRLQEHHARHREQYLTDPRPRPMGAGQSLHALHRDGHEVPVDISLSPIDAPGGALVAASVRDATERLRAEDVMRAERDHVAALIDSLTNGVIEFDADSGAYVHANRAFCDLVGMTAAEVLAVAARDYPPWVPDDQRPVVDDMIRRVRRGETPEARVLLRHSQGMLRPAWIRLSQLRTESAGLRIVGVVHDLTEDERLAAELGAARTAVQVADERDRIARDLHDRVIQGLFAAGLHLEAAACRVDAPEPFLAVVDEIDAAITEIRSSIFTLHRPRGLHTGLEGIMRSCADEASRLLGHRPSVTLAGEWRLVEPALAEESGAVVRELLSNVAKHAHAGRTWVSVDVHDGRFDLTVEDDGVGIPAGDPRRGDGLRNLVERATRRHGTAVVDRRQPSGTTVVWTVPLDATDAGVSRLSPPTDG